MGVWEFSPVLSLSLAHLLGGRKASYHEFSQLQVAPSDPGAPSSYLPRVLRKLVA